MKVTSMVDYILQIDEIEPKAVNFSSITDIRNYQLNSYSKIVKYAEFLKQPLELRMFVPCDENGNVLEEPSGYKAFLIDRCDCKKCMVHRDAIIQYQQAKERCLFVYNEVFDGFRKSDMENSNIEDLLSDDFKYTLTPNAIKQL